ncbi:MAG: prepilin-type N-terminal cleavage/methylation domain-containing protein [Candidatus Omnitrophica bacterium]|nr:prepilin-type N-terminal cleavage/methylation domain-containing protein [Candidatus Omnitrophota bacterium]
MFRRNTDASNRHSLSQVRRRFGSRGSKGFTLIELLIVIAIILILIAIALPNFLEAQIRARVVKAKGEIRALALAMEEYFLDFKTYPSETEGDFYNRGRSEFGHSWLTSPIAYLTSVPDDPFAGVTENGPRTYESGGIEMGVSMLQCTPCLATWVIYSSGPNEESEPSLRSADPHRTSQDGSNTVVTYAPTNGTRSAGVIHWYGGDPFWIGVAMSSVNGKAYKAANGSLDVGLIVDQQFYLHRLPEHIK